MTHLPPWTNTTEAFEKADDAPRATHGGEERKLARLPSSGGFDMDFGARVARHLTRGGTSLSTRIRGWIVSQLGLSSHCLLEWQDTTSKAVECLESRSEINRVGPVESTDTTGVV